MISIKPIQVPFFGEITKAEVVFENYNLMSSAEKEITLRLYNAQDVLFKEIKQPVPHEVDANWITDDVMIEWIFAQNNIVKA